MDVISKCPKCGVFIAGNVHEVQQFHCSHDFETRTKDLHAELNSAGIEARPLRRILYYGIGLMLGITATVATYILAQPGELYLVAVGPIIYGAIGLFRELGQWLRLPE